MEVAAGAEPSCATLLEDEAAMGPEDEAERSGEGGGLAVDGTREPAGEGVPDIVCSDFEDSGLALCLRSEKHPLIQHK